MAHEVSRTAVLGLITIIAFGCGKTTEQKTVEDAAKRMEDAGKKMEEAMKQGGEGMGEAMKKMGEAFGAATGKKVDPVDFRSLKALLPESLPGMKRTKAEGEKAAAMGIHVSKAEGNYRSENGESDIEITISDMGTLTGLTAMAAYGWSMTEMDRESDNGYEKTTTIGGHKAHEKFDKEGQRGEIDVLVANRFIVEMKGNGIPMDTLKGALSKVDLGKLDAMKGEGVQQ